MAQRRGSSPNKRQMSRLPPRVTGLCYPPDVSEVAKAKTYGKPVTILEDQEKNTFIYNAGNWVPHTESIAECRALGLVKELQQLGGRKRYEVRYAL